MNVARQSFPETHPDVSFERMPVHLVRDVLAIENDVFPFPWGYTSFVNCIASGYDCWIMLDELGAIVGYFVVMKVVDEAHLLTFALRRDVQGRGYSRVMLERVDAVARALEVESVFLEVRPSNIPAIRLYERFGFSEVGRRRNYYPAADNTREDAIMMRLPL